jgi:hypothetical protein
MPHAMREAGKSNEIWKDNSTEHAKSMQSVVTDSQHSGRECELYFGERYW